MWELPWDLPAVNRWEDPCESSPEPTATSLGKCGFRPGRSRHYGHDFLCPSGAGEMQEKGRELCLAFIDL